MTPRLTAHLPATFEAGAVTRRGWAGYASWVMSAVVIRRYLDRDATAETFVPLAWKFLRRVVPHAVVRPLMDDLIGGAVLECDGEYRPGEKCLCYRVGAAHRDSPIVARTVTSSEVVRKVARMDRDEREAVTDPTHRTLRDWHDRVTLLPEAPRGEHVLLDLMLDGQRRFTACEQGRVHTSAGNLPREYRRFVRLAGSELMSVDVSASQPLLLGLLLRQLEARTTAPITGHYWWGDGVGVVPGAFSAVADGYIGDCLDGSLYDRLGERTGYTRDEVKPLFLAVLYGQPEHMGTRIGEAFRALYPAEFARVVELSYRGHGWLAREMQRIESRLMIQGAAARFLREFPRVPLLTLHDSLIVPPDLADATADLIREAWASEFGVSPRLKLAPWTDPQQPRSTRHRRRVAA